MNVGRVNARRFSEMGPRAQARWEDWARSHDWGDGSHNGGTPAFINAEGRMDGLACWHVAGGEGDALEQPTFDNGEDLRAWAGY